MFASLKSFGKNRRSNQRPRSQRLNVELLESRLLMSVSPPSGAAPLVIPHVQVESVFYGQAWTSTTPPPATQPGVTPAFNAVQVRHELNTFLGAITQSGYMDQLNQYGAGRGSFLGAVSLNGPAAGSAPVAESQITGMLDFQIGLHQLFAPNASMVYVVFLPPKVQDAYDLSISAVGHHNSFTDSAGQTVYYAVVLDPIGNLIYTGRTGSETTFQYQTEALSHELAEAVTDPILGKGWQDSSHNEIGDIPQQTLPIAVGNYQGYMVADLWSNTANASVLPPNGTAALSSGNGWVSAITAVTDAGNGYLFGIGGDHALYVSVQQLNGVYGGWSSLGGYVTSFTVTDFNGWRVLAISSDGAAYTRGIAESGWTKLGGFCLQLATGKDANGRLDLFAIGGDHRVYEMASTQSGQTGFSGATWAPIHAASGDTTVSQMAISNDSGRQEVIGINSSTHAVCYIEQTAANSGWGSWAALGGWVSQIAVGSTTDGRREVFAIGGNQAVYIIRQTSSDNWTGSNWVSLGGTVKQIAIGRNLDGREEVFAIASGNNTVWAISEAAVNDAWTDSLWFEVTSDPVQALAVVLNTNQGGSAAYGEIALALIQSNNSMTTVVQTSANGGWY
jgi:hypothetical protein